MKRVLWEEVGGCTKGVEGGIDVTDEVGEDEEGSKGSSMKIYDVRVYKTLLR